MIKIRSEKYISDTDLAKSEEKHYKKLLAEMYNLELKKICSECLLSVGLIQNLKTSVEMQHFHNSKRHFDAYVIDQEPGTTEQQLVPIKVHCLTRYNWTRDYTWQYGSEYSIHIFSRFKTIDSKDLLCITNKHANTMFVLSGEMLHSLSTISKPIIDKHSGEEQVEYFLNFNPKKRSAKAVTDSFLCKREAGFEWEIVDYEDWFPAEELRAI